MERTIASEAEPSLIGGGVIDGQQEERNCQCTVPKFREEASWPVRQSLSAHKAKNTAVSPSCAPNEEKVKSLHLLHLQKRLPWGRKDSGG